MAAIFRASRVALQGGFIEKAKLHGSNALLGAFVSSGKFDQAFTSLEIIQIEPGFVKCKMPVETATSNFYGTLHGGAAATLVDIVGTMAILSKDPLRAGVSTELNCSYISAAKINTDVIIEGRLHKIGRRVAFTSVDIFAEDGKTLVATGRHTKSLPPPR
eukprot:g3381.t1